MRIGDFECNVGDILVLVEIDRETRKPSGREIRKKIGYVLKTKDFKFFKEEDIEKYGLQVMGFED